MTVFFSVGNKQNFQEDVEMQCIGFSGLNISLYNRKAYFSLILIFLIILKIVTGMIAALLNRNYTYTNKSEYQQTI